MNLPKLTVVFSCQCRLMRRTGFRLKDRALFEKYVRHSSPALSAYAFESIIIWNKLYEIFWVEIKSHLCIFFKDGIGCFLFLPPLGIGFDAEAARESFLIMNRMNKNPAVSRIENISQQEAICYRKLGCEVIVGNQEYVYLRQDVARLSGARFKKKRANARSFAKNYRFEYRPYHPRDKKACEELFVLWMQERKQKNSDPIYRRLLEDNFAAFQTTLRNFSGLYMCGRVISIGNQIKAVTIGYALSRETFVVAFEVCDLSHRGIAQYVFQSLCRERPELYINTMDDSGLENLKRVKTSYKPYKKEKSFIAYYHA